MELKESLFLFQSESILNRHRAEPFCLCSRTMEDDKMAVDAAAGAVDDAEQTLPKKDHDAMLRLLNERMQLQWGQAIQSASAGISMQGRTDHECVYVVLEAFLQRY